MNNFYSISFALMALAPIIRQEFECAVDWFLGVLKFPGARNRSNECAQDVCGKAIFCGSELGAAHLLAHRLSDAGLPAEGRRQLGEWLQGRSGSGSDWVHIQFHMAIFELECGDWEAAYSRFNQHILPAATTSSDALTDAPALLWRLQFAAPGKVSLPWAQIRATALRHLHREHDPFVDVHNLLALAGAGDIEGIERWVEKQQAPNEGSRKSLLIRMAQALAAYSAGKHRKASAYLGEVLPHISRLGGSRVQNVLFGMIAASSLSLSAQSLPRAA